jgi:hypothetical protein
MAKVRVAMTEVVNYVHEYDLAEFAEMLGIEPTVEAIEKEVDENPSSDYGVEDADMLLDDVIEKGFAGVTDREWTITVRPTSDEKDGK